jgi:CTP synthase (UTP-ammonia lyase)
MPTIALIGDYDASVPAHRAIPLALELAAERLALPLAFEWVGTAKITSAARLAHFDGVWCVPASPYRSVDGALTAIRFARETARAFLGTCGGFQHAVLEYARNVLGWADAEHGETAPHARRLVITALECSLIEVTDTVTLRAGSLLSRAYGRAEIVEGYRCRYGLNPAFLAQITAAGLRIAAEDRNGDVRALELQGHPFFVATLFQPERAALRGACPPLAVAFVQACANLAIARPSATVAPTNL